LFRPSPDGGLRLRARHSAVGLSGMELSGAFRLLPPKHSG
jgi:hypothetical protein